MLDFLFGFAHSFVFAVFTVSGIGKMVGCHRGSRIMCQKAFFDIAFAIGSCFMWWIVVNYFFGISMILIGTLAGLREVLNKNRICNCFGVLTGLFEPVQNYTRAGLVLSGLCILFAGKTLFFEQNQLGNDVLFGGIAGFVFVLMVAAYLFAKSVPVTMNNRQLETASLAIPEILISSTTVLGTDINGRTIALGDLVQPGEPLVLLLSSLSCGQCILIKNELESFLEEFSSPTYTIFENNPVDGLGNRRILFDQTSRFRKSLSIVGVPSLVVIDPVTMRVTQPIACGVEAIKRNVIQLLLNSLREPAKV